MHCELDFILKMDERHCKGNVGLHFIKAILMAVEVGWVLRVRKSIKKTFGINMVRNYARTKAVRIGKKVYTEIMYVWWEMLMRSQIFSLSGMIVFPNVAEGEDYFSYVMF